MSAAARGFARPRTAVALCDDVGDAPAPLDVRHLADRISSNDDVDVLTRGRWCSGTVPSLPSPHPAAVIVVCRNGHERREEITGRLHQLGIRFDGIDVVGAAFASDALDSAAESALLLAVHAAVAGIDAEPFPMASAERRAGVQQMSRRAALAPIDSLRLAMPAFSEAYCRAATGCRLCIEGCPVGAISRQADALAIDPDRCTGCGTCVAACATDAWRLAGFSSRQLAARLDALLRPRGLPAADGIVFRCVRARTAGVLGTGWAELVVPSLASIGPGSVLAARLAGASSVRLAACDEASCRDTAAGLEDLVRQMSLPATPVAARVEVREPDATLAALDDVSRHQGRVVHAAAPLGDVQLRADLCTDCEACIRSCPTTALSSAHADGWQIDFDPRRCVACGLCSRMCPEAAIVVVPVIDTALLTRGTATLARGSEPTCPGCGHPTYDAAVRRAAATRLASLAPGAAALAATTCGHCGPADVGVDLSARAPLAPTARAAPR